MLSFTHLVILVALITSCPSRPTTAHAAAHTQACQSGLREDNTNYIYCARQNLSSVPEDLLPNSNQQPHRANTNVLYDELVLSDNEITRIDNHSFAVTLKVRRLYLDSNPLRYIARSAFVTLRNYLEELYFDQKIAYTDDSSSHTDDAHIFEQAVFQTCFNLRTLSIKNYRIHELRATSMPRLGKLESLTVSHASLRRVDARAFAGLEHSLVELNLEANELDTLPSHALDQLRRLRRLRLAQNRIRTLHANTFLRLACASFLTSLDLAYNQLSHIDEAAFDGPVQNALRTLHVQNNELAWPHLIHVLFNLRQLVELNVDFNKLGSSSSTLQSTDSNNDNSSASLDSSTFIHLQLNSLSMQNNGLTEHSLRALTRAYDYEELTAQASQGYFF
jgi:Leucine-rich repeat (LRR) protein